MEFTSTISWWRSTSRANADLVLFGLKHGLIAVDPDHQKRILAVLRDFPSSRTPLIAQELVPEIENTSIGVQRRDIALSPLHLTEANPQVICVPGHKQRLEDKPRKRRMYGNATLSAMMQTVTTMLTAVGLKILGAVAIWIVGRWLIGLALRPDQECSDEAKD